ncbi:transport and Golgi organization protein 2 homolog [Dysidea avara]|uniref:transport and Golgi organization protein 2 homolog n=1 Tax=Dysidea avara TaxID=196820 RepID=UPI0033192FF3
MCILFFDFQPTSEASDYRFILASNRDEYFNRPTDLVNFWDDNSSICAGRDRHPVRGGGTWLGVSTTGRVATLTNVRVCNSDINYSAPSRGNLVSNYLLGKAGTTEDYCANLIATGDQYNLYNLLMTDFSISDAKMMYYTNQKNGGVVTISPGIYGLSNARLDSPWKKLLYGKEKFTSIVKTPNISKSDLTEGLLDLLGDTTRFYPDPNLPDTKWDDVSMENLSAICGHIPGYGTRTHSVILIDKHNHVTYVEKTLTNPEDPQLPSSTKSIEFDFCTKS